MALDMAGAFTAEVKRSRVAEEDRSDHALIEATKRGDESAFAEIVRNFLDADAAVQVQNPEELEKAFADLLANKQRREELGCNALKVVHENLGAIDRTVDMIVQHLEGGELYVAPGR
jgi:hypothetical protein